MVAQVAPAKGSRVLDLAPPPGGKSTHLLSYLDNTGLLVSNEINQSVKSVLKTLNVLGREMLLL